AAGRTSFSRCSRGGGPTCQAYVRMLRDDARVLRGLAPVSGGGLAAGGGAVLGGLGAKGALIGGAAVQLGAACAVSICAVGGIGFILPHHGVVSLSGAAGRTQPVHGAPSAGAPAVAPAGPSRPGAAGDPSATS